ncbi:M15 family metallopeptidase [Intestinibacter sp.]
MEKIKNIRKIELSVKLLIISIVLLFSVFAATSYINIKYRKSSISTQTSQKINKKSETIIKNINGAYNVSGTIIVNKKYGLDENYTYKNNQKLFNEATKAFNNMKKDAEKDGMSLNIISRYRSYDVQNWIYEKYKQQYSNIDTFSAKPGYSEHQTGLAFDLSEKPKTSVRDAFEFTEEYKWLRKNAYKYGFILRYPKGKSNITGYKFEPWHYRYVGENISYSLKDGDITLEEYLNIY